ncbi:MAG TPA: RAD55 family ATPase [Thermoplasmata archaeon]|nr:RAD55 family ATPase [Thermoplasmata archaeon]
MVLESPRPFIFPSGAGPPRPPDVATMPPRIPTGVPDFDFLTGGIPCGSVVLLFGEAGAGHQEFALTSAVHLMLHYDDPRLHRFFLGSAKGPFVYPESVVYVSTSRSEDQVIGEVRSSFEPLYGDVLVRHLQFRDLSAAYFRDSVVPATWAAVPSPLLGTGDGGPPVDGGPLRALAESVDPAGARNLVVVDSLTDLLIRRGVDGSDVLTLLKGLRRRAKEWSGIVYLLLSEGVAPAPMEQAVIDSVDGVLHFRWSSSPSRSHRQRSMMVEKFMPVLSRSSTDYNGRFVIGVNHRSGLVTTQYERI